MRSRNEVQVKNEGDEEEQVDCIVNGEDHVRRKYRKWMKEQDEVPYIL